MKDNRKNIFEILGNNIHDERIKKNITISELASKINIRKEYIKKIEDGKAYRITTRHIFKIAYGLGVKPHILVKNL